MVVLSGGSLVSDCCHALALCVDDSCNELECSKCRKHCTASESLTEYHERLEAPKREHQRLKDAVVEAVKEYYFTRLSQNADTRAHRLILDKAVTALIEFEQGG